MHHRFGLLAPAAERHDGAPASTGSLDVRPTVKGRRTTAVQ
jgi:hypothetical protein